MSRYAEGTQVPIERSKVEIEKVLRRYGAEQFVSGWDQDRGMVGFNMEGRHVRFVLPMPARSDYARTETGRPRSAEATTRAWEQAQRASWRSLALVIKAKLESVESGIFTFEQEFMPHILLPDGRTVGEIMVPQIAAAYETGQMPPLLPAVASGGQHE